MKFPQIYALFCVLALTVLPGCRSWGFDVLGIVDEEETSPGDETDECKSNTECGTDTCVQNECVPAVALTGVCDDSGDCISGSCISRVCADDGQKKNGDACSENTECVSGVCIDDSCSNASPEGAVCDEDTDCVSGTICFNLLCGLPCLREEEICGDAIDNNCNDELNENCTTVETCKSSLNLSDGFADSVVSKAWGVSELSGATVEEGPAGLVLTPYSGSSSSSSSVRTKQRYSIRDASVFVEVTEVPSQEYDAFFSVSAISDEGGNATLYVRKGELTASLLNPNTGTSASSNVTYNAEQHRFLRIGYASAELIYEASSNSSEWTELARHPVIARYNPDSISVNIAAAQFVGPFDPEPGVAVVRGVNGGGLPNPQNLSSGCNLSGLAETFNGDTDEGLWEVSFQSSGSASLTTGTDGTSDVLLLRLDAGNGQSSWETFEGFKAAESSTILRFAEAPDTTISDPDTKFEVRFWDILGDYIRMTFIGDGTMQLAASVGGLVTFAAEGTIPYNSANQHDWRLSFSAESIILATAPKGSSAFIDTLTLPAPAEFLSDQVSVHLTLDGRLNSPGDPVQSVELLSLGE